MSEQQDVLSRGMDDLADDPKAVLSDDLSEKRSMIPPPIPAKPYTTPGDHLDKRTDPDYRASKPEKANHRWEAFINRPEEKIRADLKWYIDRKITDKEIAKMFGVPYSWVSRLRTELDMTRPLGPRSAEEREAAERMVKAAIGESVEEAAATAELPPEPEQEKEPRPPEFGLGSEVEKKPDGIPDTFEEAVADVIQRLGPVLSLAAAEKQHEAGVMITLAATSLFRALQAAKMQESFYPTRDE